MDLKYFKLFLKIIYKIINKKFLINRKKYKELIFKKSKIKKEKKRKFFEDENKKKRLMDKY